MRYVVKAHCCREGNCFKCLGKFDKTKRIMQSVTAPTPFRAMAYEIAAAWREYDSFVTEEP